jgi:hypothetical protein
MVAAPSSPPSSIRDSYRIAPMAPPQNFASTLHMSKAAPRHSMTPAKARPVPPHLVHASSSATLSSPNVSGLREANGNNHASGSGSRASSLAGKKRPRESDEGGSKGWRRTKSTGDARGESRSAKEKEAFQRGLIAVFVPKALQESLRVSTCSHRVRARG